MSRNAPNILYIFTDQQCADTIRAAGNTDLHTPALDSIANSGVRFDRAYCTFPLCTPSRASMFTGKMPSELGIERNCRPLPAEGLQQEMGYVFKNAGYETAYAGKWHLPTQSMEDDHGFEILSPMDDELATQKSIEFIEREHDRPFLLVTSLWQPHGCCPFHRYADPRECEQLGLKRYGLSSIRDEDIRDWPADARDPSFLARCPALPENFEPTDGEVELIAKKRSAAREMPPERRPEFWAPQEQLNAARNWTGEMFRYYRWAYYQLVELLDAQVGRMLAALEQAGLRDDTLVVFSSDHGDQVGAHRLTAKNFFYEESVRIPLLMSLPGRIPAGRVVDDALVSNGLDLLPTFCDYAGIEPPEGLAGHSLRPLAEGQTPCEWRGDLVIEVSPGMGDGRMLHTGRYKYALYGADDKPEELYDLAADPGEMVNLAADPDYADVRADLRRRLLARLEERGDDVLAALQEA